MSQVIIASLIIEDSKGNSQKLKMRNSKGEVCEEIALPILDYMLSSYKSLERYFEEALKNNWISSADVRVRILSNEGVEYELPFGKNVETIFRCSESAVFRGGIRYIEKGNQPQMVSAQEFEGFFKEFLFAALSDEGIFLVHDNYFEKYPDFGRLLKNYQDLTAKEDDIYAASRANALEKGFSSCRNPQTIEDYLRDYSIFRDAMAFVRECQILKQKKEEELKQKKVKGKIIPEKKRTLIEKHEASYYIRKRSLCYIIGNNAAPLILETASPNELDDFIVERFNGAKDVRRAYKDKIMDYIKQNKEYVIQIRNMLGNNNYNGQLAILEHDEKGKIKRLSGGQYLRFSVIYTSTFKGINKLFCNIDALRKQYQQLDKELRKKETEILVKEAEYKYRGLQDKLTEVVGQLEEQSKITDAEKQKTLGEIQTIISDMKDLEKSDYLSTRGGYPTRPRMFSNHVVQELRYVKATNVPKSFKIALDEWAEAVRKSDYRYDHIRFILRHLRKKGNFKMEKKENREIEVNDPALVQTILEIDKTYLWDSSDADADTKNMYGLNATEEIPFQKK